jgi:hypothetical protein
VEICSALAPPPEPATVLPLPPVAGNPHAYMLALKATTSMTLAAAPPKPLADLPPPPPPPVTLT